MALIRKADVVLGRPRRFTEEEELQMMKYIEEGYTRKSIGEEYGITATGVTMIYRRRNGLLK